jgi:peptidoglycan-associated lipoprotein
MAEIPVKRKSSTAAAGGGKWLWLLAVLGALGLLLFFCGRTRSDTSETQTTGAVVEPARETAMPVATPAVASCTADTQCTERQLCVGGSCADISASTAECQTSTIHFETGSASISSDDRLAIDRMTRCLKADHKMKLSIEGSADERGTQQVNAKLAEDRARTVARELESRGISAEQLSVVSYGKDAPLCRGSDESCWAKNRRASMNVQPQP